MNKAQLLEKLADKVKNEGYSYFKACTHEPEKIQQVIESVMNDYKIGDEDEIDADTINDDGKVDEACESSTPIYNAELMDWLKDNVAAFDDYIDELEGAEQVKANGLYAAVASAYCYSLQQDVNHIISKLLID